METGEVRVRKEVVTEYLQSTQVPVQREEVVIERYAPTGEPDSMPDLGPGEVILDPGASGADYRGEADRWSRRR